MHIAYLELENIKSYARLTRIDFTDGLNAVCGLNGSGKTTILEAIGWALFDSLPYPQQDFLREGEKRGTVRLGLIGRDERAYEIVRGAGSGGHYVIDVETGTRLADRKETLAWIREQALDLEGETDLRALFENAVGVPQGTMTADFLKTPVNRKNVFDSLLRVEEYRKAFEELRGTNALLEKRMAGVDGEIAQLRLEVEELPEQREEVSHCEEALATARGELERLLGDLRALEARQTSLDELAAAVQRLEQDVRGAQYQVNLESERLKNAEAARDEARTAREIVAAVEAGFQRVLDARECLLALEREREQRDELDKELSAAQAERQGVWRRIEELDRRRLDAIEAAESGNSLVPAVESQTALEARLMALGSVGREGARMDGQLAGIRRQLAEFESGLEKIEAQILAARDSDARSAGIADVQRRIDALASELAEIGPLKREREVVSGEGKRLKEQRAALLEEARECAEVAERIAALTPIAAGHDELSTRQQELREERSALSAAIEYAEVARRELSRGACPLLSVACPAVQSDSGLLSRLDAGSATFPEKRRAINQEIERVSPLVQAAKTAALDLQKLHVRHAQLQGAAAKVADLEEELRLRLARHAELTKQISGLEPRDTELAGLRGTLAALQEDMKLAAALPALLERRDRDTSSVESQHLELSELERERETIAAAERDAGLVTEQLAALDDPRRRQQAHFARAAELPGIEADIVKLHSEHDEAAGRVKALIAGLEVFKNVADRIDEQQAIQRENMADHDRYVQHLAVAEKLEKREGVVTTITAALAATRLTAQTLSGELESTRASYDPEGHAEVRRMCRETAEQRAARETHCAALDRDLQRAAATLAQLEERERRLRARENDRDRLLHTDRATRFIRDTIKSAGPAVTGALLRSISQGANDIYAEIVDDHSVELRWNQEYDIIVQRGAEERGFAQLSGGEQMSAALAVRLALLKEMSEVDFAFFDEPTQNMDADRRTNLADQIRAVRGFDQLIVISHDDTFEHHTDNLIRLQKQHEETVLETG